MKIVFAIFLPFFLLSFAYCQNKENLPFTAYRHGEIYNPKTKKFETFVLCGQNIVADTNGYFVMQSGCERNIAIYLGRYTFKNDSFKISAFNFIKEPVFLHIKRIRSTTTLQKIQFFTADFMPLDGTDSSWVVRFFKGRKSTIRDKTGEKIIAFKRKRYDGIELLQMSKIFGLPVILFLDPRYDYRIAINLPKEAVERFIIGGGSIGGTGVIKNNSFFLNNQEDAFTIAKIGSIRR